MIKKIVSIFLCLCLLGLCVFAVSADDLDDLKDQRSALEQQEAEYQEILDQKNADVSDQQAQVDALVGKVQTITEEIKLGHEAIANLTEQIEEKEEQINVKNEEIDKNMDVLKQRIKTIYIAGDVSSLEIILGAKDFTDFLDKVELVQSVSKHDEELINKVKTQIDAINEEKEELEADKAEQEEEEKKLEEKQAELNATLEENREVLATLQAESNEALSSLSLTEEQLAQIEADIQQKQAELVEQQSNYSNSASYDTHSEAVDVDVDTSGGGWVWPVPGCDTITSTFADTENRAYSHGAVDIASSYGTPCVAAADGTVEYVCEECTHNWGKSDGSCSCGGGYGNYVQIDHGGGKEAIYAHFQSVCVSAGDTVKAGQVIGYMGSTGHSTGAHLHFETRYYGTKYDPMTEY